MLIEFKVANYRSFRDEQVLSLVASNYEKEIPGNTIAANLPGMSKVKLLNGAAIYGANASGKSNLMDAFRFLTETVINSAARLRPNDRIPVHRFKLDPSCQEKPSRFEVSFVASGCRYLLTVALTNERVVEESLTAYPKGKPRHWYHRVYDEASGKYQWSSPADDFKLDESLEAKTRPNALFLSVAAQFNHKQLNPVHQWFSENQSFIAAKERFDVLPYSTIQTLFSSENMIEIARKWISLADVGISDLALSEKKIMDDDLPESLKVAFRDLFGNGDVELPEKLMEVSFLHDSDNGPPVEFDWEEESDGTRRFFALMEPWLQAAMSGRVIWVDELENSLHPILVRHLILMLFSDKAEHVSQLIFTTHAPLLLEDRSSLRRDQVWFTEKDHGGATRLYPLTDYMPRKDESLVKGYLAGRYGGLPFIPEGLKI